MSRKEIKIPLKGGKSVSLFISPSKKEDIFEGGYNGTMSFQLIEGKRYYYELSSPDYYLKEDKQIISRFDSNANISNGTIVTGNYVGTFTTDVKQANTNETVGQFSIEIRSTKIGYEDDYRKMMEDITEFCTELLMQQNSPVTQRYTIDENSDPRTQYERFAFVKSLVESESFDDAISQIESQPITKWEDIEEERSIENVRRLNSRGLRQIATSRRRIKLDNTHPLRDVVDSLPEVIKVQSRRDTTDVAENRFIKFVLNSFLSFSLSIRNNKSLKDGDRLKSEADEVCQKLFQYLAHPLFRQLSNLTSMPLGSPALQKRGGYREILQKWLMFDMAAKLTWDGGEDVYNAGQKNVARLYEYWLFFKLLGAFSKKFQIEPIEKNKLIEFTDNRLGLSLKEGKQQVMKGTFIHKGRKLNMIFAYNRTFYYTNDYASPGSWSQQMRPDYTLSVWPGEIGNDIDAERQDLITHIHFDAKYRVDNIVNEFKKDSFENLLDIKHEEEKGTYKRADLLKMHAYKDAIKRSVGAYVLYPGDVKTDPFQNFHEIIPGLGAFAISPRNSNISHFLKFIDDVVDNFLNRTSLRERMQHHRYEDINHPSLPVFESFPEPNNVERTMPDDTYVIIGYTREENVEWVDIHRKYPGRIGVAKGTVIFDTRIVSAKYLLSYNKDYQKLYKVIPGLIINTKDEMIRRQYNNPRHENYLMFSLCDAEKEFDGLTFDIKELNMEAYRTKEVFTVSLVELMKVAKKEVQETVT